MELGSLRSIELNDLARAPLPIKVAVLAVLFVTIVGLGYRLLWSEGLAEIQRLEEEEASLREEYVQKKKQAIHYAVHKKRLEQIEQTLQALLRQLPNKAELDALLADINQAGIARGLEFELFKPEHEHVTEFYATLPVTIRVKGKYHDMAGFASDLAQLSRIVTMHDISLAPAAGAEGLIMEATVKTYRYLDTVEQQSAQH